MGLSDKDREVLEQLEQQLLGAKKPKPMPEIVKTKVGFARLVVLGSLMLVIGLGLLIFATSTHLIWLGVLSFLFMLFGLFFISQNWTSRGIKAAKSEGKTPQSTANFFQRRWDERNNRS